LLQELAVQALALAAVRGIALGLLVVALDLLARHAQPPAVTSRDQQEVDDAERSALRA